jgi:hypothetical protein
MTMVLNHPNASTRWRLRLSEPTPSRTNGAARFDGNIPEFIRRLKRNAGLRRSLQTVGATPGTTTATYHDFRAMEASRLSDASRGAAQNTL